MSSMLLRIAKGCSGPRALAALKFNAPPLKNTFPSAAGFHTSSWVGRKSGSMALEPKARPPSKKQMKRKAREIKREAIVVDSKTDQLKTTHIGEQFHSEEMEYFMEDVRERLQQPVAEMMLAEGLLTEKDDETASLPDVDPKATLLRLSAIIDSAATSAEKSIQLVDDVTKEDANKSLLLYARTGDIQGAIHMHKVMNALSIPLDQKVIAPLIKAATRAKDFATADKIFDTTLSDDSSEISLDMWAAKIHNLAHRRDPDGAEAILNDLIKVNLKPLPTMYSAVLGAYVSAKNFPKAYAFWERMHMESVDIDHDAFHHMFSYCLMNGQAERAFFYYDEMTQAFDLAPTLRTFKHFLEAVGTAPAFVPGYEDTLLDALALMDGKEMIPDAGVYEAVIGGFAKARDPVAAEYYFWEMQRKGIAPTTHVYANLLLSYAQAQSVGASRYGTLGRYSKPPAKKPTPDQQDLIDLGPMKVAKILNAGTYTDFEPEKHGKRVKSPKYLDAMDGGELDPDEQEELFMDEVRREVAALREARGTVRDAAAPALPQRDRSGRALLSGSSSDRKQASLDDVDLKQLADGDEGFLDLLQKMKDDPDGGLDGLEVDGMTFRKRSQHSTDGAEEADESTPERLSLDEEAAVAHQRFADMSVAKFEDPFSHMSSIRGKRCEPESDQARDAREEEESTVRRVQSVSLLDDAAAASPQGTRIEQNARSIFDPARPGHITHDDVDRGYDLVYFGRPPAADYSMPLNERRKRNIHRAELAFQHMLDSGLKPSPRCLLNLLGVYADAGRNEGVDSVLQRYQQYSVTPNQTAFRHIIKMHVQNRDLASVNETHKRMIEHNITPDGPTYGLLIETHLHRDLVVESIKLLEEAAQRNVKIPERHLRFLRNRCSTLGIKHPDLPADPNQWVKESKEIRRKQKQASQRVIEPIRSLSYN